MPPTMRSRSGCANCKIRKRKCDEARPSCLACQKRSIVCSGYETKLQWDCGIASRGFLRGATLPLVSRKQRQPTSVATRAEGAVSPATPLLEYAGRGTHQSHVSRHVFEEFMQSSVHSLYNTSTDSRLRDIIGELAEESPACYAACLALQIFHSEAGTEQFHLQFDRALQVFRGELTNTSSVPRRGSILAGLFLCTLSLEQGMPWTRHLQCMADLYGLGKDTWQEANLADEYTCHVLEMIAVMDIPNLVFGRQTPCVKMWERLRKLQALKHGKAPSGIESMTGLPRSLLDLLACQDDPGAEYRLWLWEGEDGNLQLVHFWEAWRCSAIIYARRNRERRGEQISGAGQSPHVPSTKRLTQYLVSALDALRLGLESPENSHMLMANGMFYPYVIASAEIGLLREQPEWVAALKKVHDMCLKSDTSDNIRITQSLLEAGWKRDIDVLDIHEAARQRGVELAVF